MVIFEITFSIDCKRYCKKVHQVVAETFLTKSNADFVVDHINSDRKDNRLSNLRYISASDNSSIGRSGHLPSVSRVTSVFLGDKTKIFPCIKHALDYFCVESSYYYRFRSDNKSTSKKSLYKILNIMEGQETIEIILTER